MNEAEIDSGSHPMQTICLLAACGLLLFIVMTAGGGKSV
jgi:hypothetical protein